MSKGKILFVEDDFETAHMLRVYFESQDYEVLQAAWGADGVEMSRQHVPDLVVLDIRLPDIDGYEVCRQIRRHWRTSQTPIIFLTERKEREDRISGLRLGAVDYLTKPFDMQELSLRVRNSLNRVKLSSLFDPITSLPGGKLLDSRLKDLLNQQDWAVILLSIVGLNDFSELYGFVSGNEILRAAALVLGKAVDEHGGDQSFVGDPGGGNFIVITTPELVDRLMENFVAQLKRTLTYFYPVSDREKVAGSPCSEEEQGEAPVRAIPVMSISAGAVAAKDQRFYDVKDIIMAAKARQTVVARVPSGDTL